MTTFKAFDPKTEVNGRVFSAFVSNINHTEIEGVLKRYGLDQIDLDGWYPVQFVLDVLKDIVQGDNATSNLVALGMETARVALQIMPESMLRLSLNEFLIEYGKFLLSRHRGGEIGYVKADLLSADHIIVHCKVPYPDDVMYGLFYGYTRHFCPKGKRFSLHYDENTPRRDEDGEETIYHIYIRD